MKKILKKPKRIAFAALSLLLLSAALLCSYNIIIPNEVSYYAGDAPPEFFGASISATDITVATQSEAEDVVTYEAQYRLFGTIPIKTVSLNVWKKTSLYVGGMPFGVKFFTDGLLVVGFADGDGASKNPAYTAGIRPCDIITKVNGKAVGSAEEFSSAIEKSGGSEIKITFERDGAERTVTVKPYFSKSEGKYKAGVLLRDSGAGIGTVTYIVPETGEFAGLGHGICDGETGAVIPVKRGTVSNVVISGIEKGAAGAPGEIKGYFKSGKTGTLIKNTECGVYGVFTPIPEDLTLVEVGLKGELREGEAHILCTLDDGSGIGRYSVSISNINRNAEAGKCFTVKITDPALLEKTGGIVQGMSGSPIIQNGKLVGAVTHVMINDPTTGYGIFIENMLNAAEMPQARVS